MKVLVIDEWLPWPLESGKKIRSYNLLSRLAKTNDILYMAFVDLIHEQDKVKIMEDKGFRVTPVRDTRTPKWTAKFYSQVLLNFLSKEPFSTSYHIKRNFIEQLGMVLEQEKPDLVHCEWTNLAPYLKFVKNVPCIISSHNVESDIWKRLGKHGSNIFKKIVGYSQAKKIENLEKKWYPQVNMCITVSREDQKILQGYGAKVKVVENGVDINYYDIPQDIVDPYSLIFTASFDTFSNQDGAEYFVKDIYPIIKKRIPQIQLWLVGKDPSEHMKFFPKHDSSIHVTGTVDDVRPYVSRAAVCVVPLRIGGGSRLKILEALAMKKAVISTTVGAEGLTITHDRDILLADKPDKFAEYVLLCIRNDDTRNSLAEAGYELVKEKYDWSNLANIHHEVWESVIKAIY
jgi:polysaccharide biosynthesis protein PslH